MMSAPHSSPIHISPLLHADVMVFPDDDVVETGDADDIARLDQPFGHLDVFPTRRRVPARMIVHGDKARRRQFERLAEHIARVHDRRVEPTDEERLPGDELVFCIEIQTDEMFLIQQSQLIPQQLIRILRRPNRRHARFRFLDVSNPDRERGEELLRFLLRHPFDFAQVMDGRLRQCP